MMMIKTKFLNFAEAIVYLEELCVIVHEKQDQGFTLRSSQFRVLNNCLMKTAADQNPVISLKE